MAQYLNEILALVQQSFALPDLPNSLLRVYLRRFMIVSILPSRHGKHDHALHLTNFKGTPSSWWTTGPPGHLNIALLFQPSHNSG